MKTKKADVKYCGVREDVIESAAPELDWENVYHFKRFVIDRYRVHKNKDVKKLPAPWTDNPVLREFKFTNVRREHDRQTRYLIDNIVKNEELTLEDKIVNCFMFRAWNNWDTLKDFGFPYSAKQVYNSNLKEKIRPMYKKLQIADPGRLWWSNAFIQGGVKMAWTYPIMDLEVVKHYGVASETCIDLRPFHIGPWLDELNTVQRILESKTQEECYEIIKEVKGYSDFLAYQVFVDLTYIPEFPFSENEFVVAGPGCKRGLDRIFKDRDGMTYEECIFWLKNAINNPDESLFMCDDLIDYETELRDGVYTPWRPEKLFSDLPTYDRKMNVMSIENCMCELSKYVKAVNGTGRPRNKYKGGK